jgi:site-specific DNA recombinase
MVKKKNTAQKPVKRCAIYLRVSPNDKRKRADGKDYTSIDAQRDRALAYIESQRHEHNWRFVGAYVDDQKSGKDLERKDMQRLLNDIDAGKIDVVVVYKIDRFSRSLSDFVSVMRSFEARGIAFASVTQNFQTDTPVGRLTLNILMSFAEFEREMIIERTKDKIASTRADGRWSGGLPPFGYDADEGELIVNESERTSLIDIFENYLETKSLRDVAATLNEGNVPTKKRGKHARAWTPDMVGRVLRCQVPTGVITHGDNVYPGKHTAILDPALFERAQAVLAENAIDAERKARNPDYILQGVIRCACVARNGRVCNGAMCPGTSGNRKGSFRYYRCNGRDKGRDGCEARALPAEAIEAFVVDRLREIAASGKVAEQVTAHARELATVHRTALLTHASKQRAILAEVTSNADRIAERMAKATSTARVALADKAEKLVMQADELEADVRGAEEKLRAIDAAETESRWLAEQLGSFAGSWDHLTPEMRNRVIRGLVRSVNVDESKHQIAIVFAPLDETRRALLADSDGADRFVSVVTGELHRTRKGKGIGYAMVPKRSRPTADRPAKLARTLAVAHNVDRAIASGACPNMATMAARLNMTRARVTQVMDLIFLAPDIQETILSLRAIEGREPLRERALRPIALLRTWDEQRAAWEPLRAAMAARMASPRANPHKRGKRA